MQMWRWYKVSNSAGFEDLCHLFLVFTAYISLKIRDLLNWFAFCICIPYFVDIMDCLSILAISEVDPAVLWIIINECDEVQLSIDREELYSRNIGMYMSKALWGFMLVWVVRKKGLFRESTCFMKGLMLVDIGDISKLFKYMKGCITEFVMP